MQLGFCLSEPQQALGGAQGSGVQVEPAPFASHPSAPHCNAVIAVQLSIRQPSLGQQAMGAQVASCSALQLGDAPSANVDAQSESASDFFTVPQDFPPDGLFRQQAIFSTAHCCSQSAGHCAALPRLRVFVPSLHCDSSFGVQDQAVPSSGRVQQATVLPQGSGEHEAPAPLYAPPPSPHSFDVSCAQGLLLKQQAPLGGVPGTQLIPGCPAGPALQSLGGSKGSGWYVLTPFLVSQLSPSFRYICQQVPSVLQQATRRSGGGPQRGDAGFSWGQMSPKDVPV